MSIKKLYCSVCGSLVGAVNEDTGEREYVGGFRLWDDEPYCRECYNKKVLEHQPFMGGIDGIEIED